jgi:hypothetical protein
MSAAPVLERLRAAVAGEPGALADSLVEPPAGPDGFGALASAGARVRGAEAAEYELLVESIFEGYLLHYAEGRIVRSGDPDLRLLAGDYLYAFGLTRLARLGDLEAVAELADLISLCAQAHAPARAGSGPSMLARAAWSLAALAVGDGGWEEQREAKRRLHSRPDEESATHAAAVARERARVLGRALDLDRALIAFDRSVGRELSTT